MSETSSTSQAHHEQMAAYNQEVIDRLIRDDLAFYSPWIATAAFYKAVHLVEILFHAEAGTGPFQNVRPTDNHADRNGILRTYSRYNNLQFAYNQLQSVAHDARYKKGSPSLFIANQLTPEYVRDRVVGHHLRQVEAIVLGFLQRHDPGLVRRVNPTN